MIIPGTDAMDGSHQSGTIKNVTSSAGNIGQQFFQGGGVYNTTTQDFGTEKYYTSGRYDNNLYGNAGFQKFSNMNMNTLDTWNTNGRYLDRVSLTYMTFLNKLTIIYEEIFTNTCTYV